MARKILGADQYNSYYDITDSDSYPWWLLANFSKSIGLVKKNKYCDELKLNLYDMRVYGHYTPLEPLQPTDLLTCKEKLYYEQNCNLIAEELGNNKYKIIHCDLGKNYFRGLLRAYRILEPLTENSENGAKLRAGIILNLFRKEINKARTEAGYSALSYEQDLVLGSVFTPAKARTVTPPKNKNRAGKSTGDRSACQG